MIKHRTRPQSIDELSATLLDLAERMDEMSSALHSIGNTLGGVARVRANAVAKVDRVGGGRTLAIAGGVVVAALVARKIAIKRADAGPHPDLDVVRDPDGPPAA